MTEYEQRNDRFTAIEDQYAGYAVYDPDGSKIGKVDDLFLDEDDRPEYIGVKIGFLGTSSTLIPMDVVTIDQVQGTMTVSKPKSTVQEGPAFDDDREITPEYESEVRSYYGLPVADGEQGAYGDYYGDGYAEGGAATTETSSAGTVGAGMSMGDTETGEFREHDRADEGVYQSHGDDLEDEDELRVQRTEEELAAGTREREAGSVKVRKRVRTDREQIEVPTRHEEVAV